MAGLLYNFSLSAFSVIIAPEEIWRNMQSPTIMHYLRNVASDENEAAKIMEEVL
jgi:hypothetical protein